MAQPIATEVFLGGSLVIKAGIQQRVTLAAGQVLPRGAVLGRVTATNEFRLSAAAAGDGSERPLAVLAVAADTTAGAAPAQVLTGGVYSSLWCAYGEGYDTASIKAALEDAGWPMFIIDHGEPWQTADGGTPEPPVEEGPFTWLFDWELIIDPGNADTTGGIDNESFAVVRDIAVSPDQSVIYVVGGSTDDLPHTLQYLTTGYVGQGSGRPQNAYAAAINATTGAVIWCTELGDDVATGGYHRFYSCALTPGGDELVCAGRGGGGWPVTSGVVQEAFVGGIGTNSIYGKQKGIVAVLATSDGSRLAASYVPGTATDHELVRGVAVDEDSNIWCATTRPIDGGNATGSPHLVKLSLDLTTVLLDIDFGAAAQTLPGQPSVVADGENIWFAIQTDVDYPEPATGFTPYLASRVAAQSIWAARLDKDTGDIERWTYYETGSNVGGETNWAKLTRDGLLAIIGGGPVAGATPPLTPDAAFPAPIVGETTAPTLTVFSADLDAIEHCTFGFGAADGLSAHGPSDRIGWSFKSSTDGPPTTNGSTGVAPNESAGVIILNHNRALEFGALVINGTVIDGPEGRDFQFLANGDFVTAGISDPSQTASGQWGGFVQRWRRFSPSAYDPLTVADWLHWFDTERGAITAAAGVASAVENLGSASDMTSAGGVGPVHVDVNTLNGNRALTWQEAGSLLLAELMVSGTFVFVGRAELDRSGLHLNQQTRASLCGTADPLVTGFLPRMQDGSSFATVWNTFASAPTVWFNGVLTTWTQRQFAWDAIITGEPFVLIVQGTLTTPTAGEINSIGHVGPIGNAAAAAWLGEMGVIGNTADVLSAAAVQELDAHLKWKWF